MFGYGHYEDGTWYDEAGTGCDEDGAGCDEDGAGYDEEGTGYDRKCTKSTMLGTGYNGKDAEVMGRAQAIDLESVQVC